MPPGLSAGLSVVGCVGVEGVDGVDGVVVPDPTPTTGFNGAVAKPVNVHFADAGDTTRATVATAASRNLNTITPPRRIGDRAPGES